MNWKLWILAILTFVVGDVVTTWYGITHAGAREAAPVAAQILTSYGTTGMLSVKVLLLLLMGAVALRVPQEHRVGVPVGFILVGTVVTLWNLTVIL